MSLITLFLSLLLQSISMICNDSEAWFKNEPSKYLEGKQKFSCLNNTLKIVAIEDFKEDLDVCQICLERKGDAPPQDQP